MGSNPSVVVVQSDTVFDVDEVRSVREEEAAISKKYFFVFSEFYANIWDTEEPSQLIDSAYLYPVYLLIVGRELRFVEISARRFFYDEFESSQVFSEVQDMFSEVRLKKDDFV